MASRSKWEDMVNEAKSIIGIDNNKPPVVSDAPLGSGIANQAKNAIQDYAKRQKDAIDNQTNGN